MSETGKLVVCFSLEGFHRKMEKLVMEGWHIVEGSVRQTGNNTFLFRIR